MKTISHILFVVLLALPLASSRAQTDSDFKFQQLQAEHGKAFKEATEPLTQRYREEVRTATDPINQRYQESLEKLLDHATQEGDFDTAVKIKTALDALPQAVAKQLAGVWALRVNTGYTATVAFQSGGTGRHSRYGNFRWRIEGTTLYLGDTDTADKFQLPISEGRLKGVNSLGNELTLTRQ